MLRLPNCIIIWQFVFTTIILKHRGWFKIGEKTQNTIFHIFNRTCHSACSYLRWKRGWGSDLSLKINIEKTLLTFYMICLKFDLWDM